MICSGPTRLSEITSDLWKCTRQETLSCICPNNVSYKYLVFALRLTIITIVPIQATDGASGASECWFYALDNKSRDADNRTTDPVFVELRAALTQIARDDARTVKGLNGKDTRYLEFEMPIKALELLDSLKHLHGRVCLMKDVHREAKLFALDGSHQVETLLEAFKDLGMILYFPKVPGCDQLVIPE